MSTLRDAVVVGTTFSIGLGFKVGLCALAAACMVPALGQPWWDLFLLNAGIVGVVFACK
jgi:hypothetical protein